MKIKYEMNHKEGESGWLYTKCPYRVKGPKKTYRDKCLKVGSKNCQECKYFEKIDSKKQIVFCNYKV